MRILLIHLSDIHISNGESINNSCLNAIISSFRTLGCFERAILIISGDIAFSGKLEQYATAYKMYRKIKDETIRKYNLKSFDIVIVPGNHDIDYDKIENTKEEYTEIFKKGQQDKFLNAQLSKMKNFYIHANGVSCFQNKMITIDTKTLKYDDTNIKINMINTACFSLKDEEDQGYHYLYPSELDKLHRADNDIVITVMHHPHYFFNYNVKNDLNQAILQSDIILCGHEHSSNTYGINTDTASSRIIAGGCLADQGNWSESEYYAGVIDTERMVYDYSQFKRKGDIYCKARDYSMPISPSINNKFNIGIKKNYIDDINLDKKYMISDNINDYFVFPLLSEESIYNEATPIELSSFELFDSFLSNHKYISITGHSGAGKTVLLKHLLNKYLQSKICIFVSGNMLKMQNYKNVIKNTFEDIYTSDTYTYNKFCQLDKEDKMLLIDDADKMDTEKLSMVLQYAESEFGYIIYTWGKDIELDLKEKIKRNGLNESFSQLSIERFYKDKRKELITKVICTLSHTENGNDTIIQRLEEALSAQKKLFRLDPDFIVQFCKYYYVNIGDLAYNDINVFSKVFEANITSLIQPNAKRIAVEKIFIVLDKISYHIHKFRSYPISQDEIITVIKEYNDYYDEFVDVFNFMEIVTSSHILKKYDNTHYIFSEKSYLAYFIAREIKRQFTEFNNFNDINNLIKFACYGINTDILLFITYITENMNILRLIMSFAEEYTKDWVEFDVDNISVKYLTEVTSLELNKLDISDEQLKIEEKQEIENEKEMVKISEDTKIDIYNDEGSEFDLVDQMIRALSLLIIISRSMPSFEHSMLKTDKIKCTKLLYSLPLKIFNLWANEAEKSKDELTKMVLINTDWSYDTTDLRNLRKLKEGVLKLLQLESTSLLLTIMNVSMYNASRDNTYHYIDQFDYQANNTFSIEHLMSIDQRKNSQLFLEESQRIDNSTNSVIAQYMIRRIAKHFIITSPQNNKFETKKIMDKYFNKHKTKLLIEKERYINKNK